MPLSTIFQLYHAWWSVLLVEETGVSGKKPLTCRKTLTNFITFCWIEYTLPEWDSNSQR